jgi:hypothetical protein
MSYVRGNPYATRGQSQADARRLAWEKQQKENRKKEEEAKRLERAAQIPAESTGPLYTSESGMLTSRSTEKVKKRPTYKELFGGISPEETAKRDKTFNSFESYYNDKKELFTEDELLRAEEAINTETADYSIHNDLKKRQAYSNNISRTMGNDYNYIASDFQDAKTKADEVYIQSLKNALSKETEGSKKYNEILSYIEQGPLDFTSSSTFEDIAGANLSKSTSTKEYLGDALNSQAMVMADFLNRNNIDVKQDSGIPYDDRPEGVGKYSYLNTGTMAHALSMDGSGTAYGTYGVDFETADRPEDMSTVMMTGNTELGTYSYYTYVTPESVLDEKPWLKPFQGAMDVLSVVYPPLAPVFQGAGELAETEDLDEALKAAGKTYVVKELGAELTNAASELTDNIFTNAQIDLSGIPEPVKNVVGDTVGGVLSGDSLDDAFTGAITKQTGRAFVSELDIDAEQLEKDFKVAIGLDPNANIPKPLKNIIEDTGQAIADGKSGSNAFDSSVKSEVKDFVGDVTEEGIKYVAGEAGELLVSAGELAGDVFGSTIDALGPVGDLIETGVDVAGEVLSPIGDVIEAGAGIVGEAGQGVIDLGKDIGEAVVDTADDLLDTFGEEFVDPALKEGKKVAEAVVDKADDALDYLGEEYVDPALQQGKEIGQDIIDKGKDIGEGIVDTVDNVVDKFGEEAVDPALAKAKDLGQDLIDKGKDIGEAVVDTVDDALDYLGEEYVDPALQALKDIELPEGPELEFPKIDIDLPELNVDLPEFTAPDIDFPEIDIDLPEVDIDLPSIDLAESEEKEPQQPTQVEGLFDKELFKFDTKIKSTQQMLSPLMNLRRYG